MTLRIVQSRYLITRVLDRHTVEQFDGAGILVRDGLVELVAPFDELVRAHPDAQVCGGPDLVVLPGFVNSHHHVGLTPLQLGSPDYALELWIASRLGARYPDPYYDTLYSAFEMLASGITSVQHIHGLPMGSPEERLAASNAVLAAYNDIGMRASYCFGMRDQSFLTHASNSDFESMVPAALRPQLADFHRRADLDTDIAFDIYHALRDEHAGKARTAIQFCPANLHWCSDDLLVRIAGSAADDGVSMHMHLVESVYQKAYGHRRAGKSALLHLNDLGILGPSLTLGHGVWIDHDDIDVLAASGTCLCHNCSSNLRLRSGVAPLNALEKAGVTLAIGIDEAGINDDRDMLQEMRMVLLQHRTPGFGDDVPTPAQVLRMATTGGAATMRFGAGIGELVPGKAADLVGLDWSSISRPYLDHGIDVLTATIHRAKTTGVKMTMVAGEVVYCDGEFSRVDRAAAEAALAEDLARPDSAYESDLKSLSVQVFPHVKKYFEGYGDLIQNTEPFYRTNAR